jgi:SEC-C motif-containing protein
VNAGQLSGICPCGRLDAKSTPLAFAQCCGRWLGTDAPAPDAQSLMRSRYCAFVLHNAPYLLKTWHASKRPSKVSFDAGVKWLGLEVRDAKNLDADHAEVEFVARQREPGGRAVRLVERSRFVREEGAWFYVDGTHL